MIKILRPQRQKQNSEGTINSLANIGMATPRKSGVVNVPNVVQKKQGVYLYFTLF